MLANATLKARKRTTNESSPIAPPSVSQPMSVQENISPEAKCAVLFAIGEGAKVSKASKATARRSVVGRRCTAICPASHPKK
jgi:hypothetical protein